MDIARKGSRYRNAALLGCTALVALAPALALGQQAEKEENGTTLQTIVVEGSGNGKGNVLKTDNDSKSIVATATTANGRMPTSILYTPASVSVITAKEMQDRGADSVEQVLKYTAGVTADFYGSDDRFDYFKIRGFDAYMYRDGLPIGRPFGGLREEPYAYERIEVLKGASSAGLGVADPGGSVNYVTKLPKSGRFGEAYVSGGSFNHAETGFDFGDNITRDDTLSYRLTGKFRKADKEYDYSQDDENFIMGGLTWRPSGETSLSLVFDHLGRDSVAGGGGHPSGSHFDRSRFFGEPDYNHRDTNRNSVSALLDHDFGGGLTLNANARYSKANSNFAYVYISATPTNSTIASRAYFGNENATEQLTADAHLQYEREFGPVESRSMLGVDFARLKADTRNYWGAAPGINWVNPVYTGAPVSVPLLSSTATDQTSKAIYLQQEVTLFDKVIVSGGLRNDWLDLDETNRISNVTRTGDFSEFSKRIGLSYKITGELAAYASYASSVAPPKIGTAPETGEQYEIGVKYQPDAFPALFTASVYDLTKKNITVTDPVTSLPSAIGEVRHRGVDLEAKAEVTDNVSLTAAYSYLDSEIVENGTGGNVGKRLALVPTHTAAAWVNYTLPGEGARGDMSFGLGARYTGAYFMSNANTVKADGFVVFDAAFNYKIRENTAFQVNVSNLFNEKHIDYGGFGADWYNPGRAVVATLRQSW